MTCLSVCYANSYSLENWTLHESDTFTRLTFAMSDAQMYRNVTWVVGDAGCGKTTAAIEYRRTHRNVFYILCSEDMKKSDFVREIAKQVGAPVDGTNLRDILEYSISMIAFLKNPILIFDEGDKLTDPFSTTSFPSTTAWKVKAALSSFLPTISNVAWRTACVITRKAIRR